MPRGTTKPRSTVQIQLGPAAVKLQDTTWSKVGTIDFPVPAAGLPSHTNPVEPAPRHDALPMCPTRQHGEMPRQKRKGEKKENTANFDTNPAHPGLLLIYPKNRDSYQSECSKERKMAEVILFSIKSNSSLPKMQFEELYYFLSGKCK